MSITAEALFTIDLGFAGVRGRLIVAELGGATMAGKYHSGDSKVD